MYWLFGQLELQIMKGCSIDSVPVWNALLPGPRLDPYRNWAGTP